MMSEAQEQCKLIKWADKCVQMKIHPELSMLYAVPNGGRRDKAEAAHLKRQGVRAGVPDLFLPVSRGGYHGLFIELKYGKNKPTKKQTEWLKSLNEQGYAVAVCYGCDEASEKILKYLKLGEINE